MKVLVTGGAGYIGSTICSALLDTNNTPIILDSLITGKIEFTKDRIFYKGDIEDFDILEKIFQDHPDINYVIHCAALIVVPDSVENPYDYYNENVVKSLKLFHNLKKLNCKNIVFSSSASVYDDSDDFTVSENSNLNPRSPYARTKYMMEMILKDFSFAYDFKAIALRYFNPIGADPKLRTGSHIEFPSHVLGKLIESGLNNQPFNLTGTNWITRDGTGIRDYIHVWDLAMAHVKAILNFEKIFNNSNYEVINLGNGQGVTVSELITAFENVLGSKLTINKVEPRPGDVAGAYAKNDKALKLLDWNTNLSIEDGISDSINWSKKWFQRK